MSNGTPFVPGTVVAPELREDQSSYVDRFTSGSQMKLPPVEARLWGQNTGYKVFATQPVPLEDGFGVLYDDSAGNVYVLA